MNVMTLRFTALDTLFFRESRPFETIGGSELTSMFPPPPRTLAGAIRTAIGDSLGADWQMFCKKSSEYTVNGFKLKDIIGINDDMGRVSIKGIWLAQDGTRLYPVPLFLIRKGPIINRLQIGKIAQTFLGQVRLPELPKDCVGFKPLENVWLTRTGLEKVLSGGLPSQDDIREKKHLYTEESRLGIARDQSKRAAENGLLYQSRHVRPFHEKQLTIEADIIGLDKTTIARRLVRVGGEGRLAGIEAVESPSFPHAPVDKNDVQGVVLILLSPARFKESTWLPAGFSMATEERQTWKGEINGISLTVHSAVIGKAQREGGWDMAAYRPRAVQSLIPAGSALFCTVENNDITGAIKALHGHYVGEDQSLGRGRIACALWNTEK